MTTILNSLPMRASIAIFRNSEKNGNCYYFFSFLMLLLLTAPYLNARGQEEPSLRVALPYRHPSLELSPLYLAEQSNYWRHLTVELAYQGSSRAAIESLLQEKADAALVDAAVFIYYASQSNYLLGFMQYFQSSPFVIFSTPGQGESPLTVNEEDGILTALLHLDQRQSEPGTALFKNSGPGWIYRDTTCQIEELPFFDQKQFGRRLLQTHARHCRNWLGPEWDFAGRPALLARRLSAHQVATGLAVIEAGGREWLPGSLFITRGEKVHTLEPLLRLFATSLRAAMDSVFLFPDQIFDRGLTPFRREWTAEELAQARQMMQAFPTLLSGNSKQKTPFSLGSLYAWRYQKLVAKMEALGLIEQGLSSRDLLVSGRFKWQPFLSSK